MYHCITKDKIPGINLPKEGKDMYSETYKTVMKEIEGDTNRWKDTLSSWTGRINIVKINLLLRSIYIFNAVSIKIPIAFFTELKQIILKFV